MFSKRKPALPELLGKLNPMNTNWLSKNGSLCPCYRYYNLPLIVTGTTCLYIWSKILNKTDHPQSRKLPLLQKYQDPLNF
jgi:hypothetical protein